MFNIGPQELLLILLVALVIVGPKRLPEISRTIGRGLREFRKAQDEVTKTIRLGLDDLERAPEPTEGSDPAPQGDTAAEAPGEAEAPASMSAGAAGSSEDAAQVARTLGRGLAEIRKSRREIQRTFRIDLTDDSGRPAGPTASPAPPPAEEPPAATRPDEPSTPAGPG